MIATLSGPTVDRTKLYFFYGPNYYDYRIYDYNELDDILSDVQFDANRTTTFYIHGYRQNLEMDDIRTVVDAYNTRNEQNLIVYDWSQAAGGDYLTNAVPNAVAVSETHNFLFVKLLN